MVVSFLREGGDGRKAYTLTLCIIFEGSKIQSFALPYLLKLIVFFILLAKQALRKFPQRMSGWTLSSLELRLPGKVPSARISSFVVQPLMKRKCDPLMISMFLVNLKHLQFT